MKKIQKLIAYILIIIFIIGLFIVGNIIVYAKHQNKCLDKINICRNSPSKAGCFNDMFDILAAKLLVYNYKIKGIKKDNNFILLERNFARNIPRDLLEQSDVLLGWGISKDIELEDNYSILFNRDSYGFDCGIDSIKTKSKKCKFQSECIGTDKYIKTNLGQSSSSKIHNFKDKIKELELEDKKLFVKLSFDLNGELDVIQDILENSSEINAIAIALQINNTSKIDKAIELVNLLDKDFILVSRNASTIRKNDKAPFGRYINTPSYKGYLGYNLFFLIYANKNILENYSISLNQNDNLFFNLRDTTKIRYEDNGKKIKVIKENNIKDLNISAGKIKFPLVFIEKLKEAGIIKTR